MPTLAQSINPDMTGYTPVSGAHVSGPVQGGTIPSPIPMPTPNPIGISRSPVMIASLPGIGSGPDAVIRQFYSGARTQRLLVP